MVDAPGDVLDRIREQAARLGAATLTRYAEVVHAGLGEMRGATAPRLLLEHYLRGTQRVYQYELVDERPETGLTDPEQHFGLLRNDFTPKPAFRSLTRLLGLAEDPGPAFAPQPLAIPPLPPAPSSTPRIRSTAFRTTPATSS